MMTVGELREQLKDVPDDAPFGVYLEDWALPDGNCRPLRLTVEPDGEEWYVTLWVELLQTAVWDSGAVLDDTGLALEAAHNVVEELEKIRERMQRVFGHAEEMT